MCLYAKTFERTICLPLLLGALAVYTSQHFCFLTRPRAYSKEKLLGYWLVMWHNNLLAVVCVSSSSSMLHAQCSVLCVQMENPRDFSFNTWQWMQQQQSPLLTADKDAEGQLLGYRLSWVKEYTTHQMNDGIKSNLTLSLSLLAPVEHKNMFRSYRVSCCITSGHSSLRFLSGIVCCFSESTFSKGLPCIWALMLLSTAI